MNKQRFVIPMLLLPVMPLLLVGCVPVSESGGGNDIELINAGGDDSTAKTSSFALGAGVPTDIDPAPFGATWSDELQELYPTDDVEILGALPVDETAPLGAAVGMAMSDGTRLYLIGIGSLDDGDFEFLGSVLEDARGNLLLRQINTTSKIVTLQFATGDSVTINASQEGRVGFSLLLFATDPPSKLQFEITADGEAIDLTDPDDIYTTLRADYNSAPVRLPRATSSRQRIPMKEGAFCDYVTTVADLVSTACTTWSFITSVGPAKALDKACLLSNGALDGYRGSVPFGLLDDKPASRLIAGLKIGLNGGCAALKTIWALKGLAQKLTPPDLVCLGITGVDELARFASDGDSFAENFCEAVEGLATPIPIGFTIPAGPGCADTCITANDGLCDDGGPLSDFARCDFGTDCQDCSARKQTPPEEIDCTVNGDCNLDCPRFKPDGDCTSEQLCAANGTCCPDDGICDITTCTTTDDPECTNFDVCDRQGICCEDDEICDELCPQEDPQCAETTDLCGGCPAGTECFGSTLDDCAVEAPECAGPEDCADGETCDGGACVAVSTSDCPTDALCDLACIGTDPDCDLCGSGDGCVLGCSDPDCNSSNCPGSFIGGLCFVQGDISFADIVLRYDNEAGGKAPTASTHLNPSSALGAPDYDATVTTGLVSLGHGGILELGFTSNVLTNSGNSAADLKIFEVGADVEATFVALQAADGDTASLLSAAGFEPVDGWYEIGAVGGSTSTMDLDAALPGFSPGKLLFSAIRLIDDPDDGFSSGATVGADIDAVGAITTIILVDASDP